MAGGQESMSNVPYYVYGMRNGVKLGDQQMVDGVVKDGLWCASCDVHMGGHAEYTAKKAGISRQMADEFSAGSHRKAVAAAEAGKFRAEIVPVEVPGRKGATVVEADDGRSPRVRLDVVGRHRVSAGGSAAEVMKALAVEPLARHGIAMTDIDDFATELHNPEITEPQGSGNVPERNYKMIAGLAVRRGDIPRDQMAEFAARIETVQRRPAREAVRLVGPMAPAT